MVGPHRGQQGMGRELANRLDRGDLLEAALRPFGHGPGDHGVELDFIASPRGS
jgi:hypothetical protein